MRKCTVSSCLPKHSSTRSHPFPCETLHERQHPPTRSSYVKREADYTASNDHTWEKKTNMVYWVVSTSGGCSTSNSWYTHHRQRFVTLANLLQNMTHTFLTESRPGVWKMWISRETLLQLYNINSLGIYNAMSRISQPSRRFFRFGTAFRYRFVFDLEGNGFGGRFYGFWRVIVSC